MLEEIRNPAINKEDEQPTVDPPAEVCDLVAGAGGNEVLPVVIEESADQTPLQSNGTDQFGSDLAGAVKLKRSEAAPTITAAPSALSLSPFEQTAWERLSTPEHGGELIDALDASTELRSASLLRSIERFRDCLDVLPTNCPLEAPQTLLVGEVVVLVKAVISRLR